MEGEDRTGSHGPPVARKLLYTPERQEIIAKYHYRPRDPAVLAPYAAKFPKLELVTVDGEFGGWRKAHAAHFADGGSFDRIYVH